MTAPPTDDELAALASVMRDQRETRTDRSAALGAIREYLRTVRYHGDPKVPLLKSVWAKLTPEAPPPTPMLKVGPHRPKRR